jgi:hypothetical protein
MISLLLLVFWISCAHRRRPNSHRPRPYSTANAPAIHNTGTNGSTSTLTARAVTTMSTGKKQQRHEQRQVPPPGAR